MKNNRIGKIIIPGNINIWPHEMETARVLALNGYKVEFIRKSNREREHSADAYIDGEKWEFKSPNAKHLGTIIKNLKDARWQSDKLVFDSRRMKHVPDNAIVREITVCAKKVPELSKIKYISKNGKLIDIK